MILVVLLFFAIFDTYKISENKKHYNNSTREERKAKYEIKIVKGKKRRQCFVAVAIVVSCIISYLLFQQSRYEIREEFAWDLEERYDVDGLHFDTWERKMPNEKIWYEEMLHKDWSDKINGDYIDRDALDFYMDNTWNIFLALPEKENRIGEFNGEDSIFENKKKNFESLVNSNHESLSSEELWKGYEDGIEVCKVYETSENVFQTGVLAESASENAYRTNQSFEACMLYIAGMFGQFEKFLGFRRRDAGADIIISEVTVCFRMEKGLYRASKLNSNYDRKSTMHYGLMAYCCSQYSIDKTEIDNNNYLVYLDNNGLCCLNIMPYINDKTLRAELCQKVLDRWKLLDGRDMSIYKTERKTLEEIMRTKERLENYVDFSE